MTLTEAQALKPGDLVMTLTGKRVHTVRRSNLADGQLTQICINSFNVQHIPDDLRPYDGTAPRCQRCLK
ncbi:hypothetical protein N9917_03560 [Deltaproteobacteria bacterium]|nr:hypothetical protein [Deltaproteobacteria bacterium]